MWTSGVQAHPFGNNCSTMKFEQFGHMFTENNMRLTISIETMSNNEIWNLTYKLWHWAVHCTTNFPERCLPQRCTIRHLLSLCLLWRANVCDPSKRSQFGCSSLDGGYFWATSPMEEGFLQSGIPELPFPQLQARKLYQLKLISMCLRFIES